MNAYSRDTLTEAGGSYWEKGNKRRVYFNDSESIAKLLGLKLVAKQPGEVMYTDEIKSFKAKSFYNLNDDIFWTNNGQIANAARREGLSVARI